MKKLMLAFLSLIVALIVALVVFVKLGYIDVPSHVLSLLEKSEAAEEYMAVYHLGLQYQEGLLSIEDALAERKEQLSQVQAELEARKAELVEMQNELEATAKNLDTRAAAFRDNQKKLELREAELAAQDRMAKVYADMEPKAAAKILLSLNTAESADLLRRMSNKDVTEILPELPPDQAAELGRAIAVQ